MRNNAWVALAIVGIIIAFALSSSNGGVAGNAFTTMAVPNGTNPVATSASDTLTFAEGSNITITGDSSTDTITIAATGAGSGDITSVGDCTTGDCFVLGGLGSELTFDPSNTVTYEEGRIYYDSDVNAFTAFNNEPDVALNIGEETWTFVRNNSGSTISNGQAVYISGAIGNIPTIALAQADAVSTSNVVALATHDIENNTTGYVTTFGAIRGLNTSAFTEGDELYLSASTAGGVTTTRSESPDFDVFVGTLTVSHVTQGIIYVDIRGRNSRTDCSALGQALTFNTTTEIQGCNTIYETGTFTPGVADSSFDPTGEGQIYNGQLGHFTRIGNRVLFNIRILVDDMGTLTTGSGAFITPLPFTSTNISGLNEHSVTVGKAAGMSLGTAGHNVTGFIAPSTNRISLQLWDSTGGTTSLLISEMGAFPSITISGQYEIDE